MISDEEFIERIRLACEAYGIREFAIYGRFAQAVNADGKLVPAIRYAYCKGKIVAEEASYYLNQLAEQVSH